MTDANIPLIDHTAREQLEQEHDTNKEKDLERSPSTQVVIEPKYDEHEHEQFLDNLRSLLHQHAREGNCRELERLLLANPSVIDRTDSDEYTALHYAARYGNYEVVCVLIRFGACVSAVNEDSWTPLHVAAKYFPRQIHSSRSDKQKHSIALESNFAVVKERRGSLPTPAKPLVKDATAKIVDKLIANGADSNCQDNFGLRPLHYAAMRNNVSAAAALLQNGCHVDPEDNNDMTPLMTGCVHGSDDVVEMLLDAGADRTRDDNRNNTTLHIAAQHGNLRTMKILLNRAGVNSRELLRRVNNDKKTALALAVEGDHVQVVSELLRIMADGKQRIKYWEKSERSLLHLAARKGYLDCLRELVSMDFPIHSRDECLRTALHDAAAANQPDACRFLLDTAPDLLESADDTGQTALLLAAPSNALEAIKVLVSFGANPLAIDKNGKTVVYMAAKYNGVRLLEYMIELFSGKAHESRTLRPVGNPLKNLLNACDQNQDTPMHIVAANGYIETCQLLYSHGARIDVMNEDEETPLHLAAARGRTAVVRQLVEWDRRTALHKDDSGDTPLHSAAKHGHDIAVGVLLGAGADIQASNVYEETALHCATRGGHLEVVRTLIQKGAPVEGDDDPKCLSPLHIAAQLGHDRVVAYLLQQGACIDRKTKDGLTALDLAIQGKHKQVSLVLVNDPNWELVMRCGRDLKAGESRQLRDTPLRRLIHTAPEVAAVVFDKCISTVNEPGNINYCESYNFEYLDDTYMQPSGDGKVFCGDVSAYDEDGKLMKTARTYTNDYDTVYLNHPLKLIAHSERMSLLSHPLAVGLLKYKWNHLGRYVYYFALAIYTLFILTFTVYISQTPAPYNVRDPAGNDSIDLSETLSHAGARCEHVTVAPSRSHDACKMIVVVLGVAQLIKECLQVFERRLAYLSWDNALECFIYASAIVTVIDLNPCSAATGIRMTWQWLLAAVCAFLAWMNLLLLIRKLPRFGIYVVMFFDIVKTFSRFFIIFLLFIIAFSISFFIIWQNRPEFSSMHSSILKTMVMMIGEFEFTAIFHGDADAHAERLFGHEVAYPLFFFFCIIMTILLMNLLVGLAVDDIKSVQEKAELKRLSMQVDLVLQVETSMAYVRRSTSVARHSFYPNRSDWWKRLRNRFGVNQSAANSAALQQISAEEESAAEVQRQLVAQSRQIAHLQDNIDFMYEKQVAMEDMLRAILRHQQIEWQETDQQT